MSAFDEFLAERHNFLRLVNPPAREARVVLAPGFVERLEADQAYLSSREVSPPGMVAGIPFVIDKRLPSDTLAIFYSGAEPFDPRHPERTVVLRRGSA